MGTMTSMPELFPDLDVAELPPVKSTRRPRGPVSKKPKRSRQKKLHLVFWRALRETAGNAFKGPSTVVRGVVSELAIATIEQLQAAKPRSKRADEIWNWIEDPGSTFSQHAHAAGYRPDWLRENTRSWWMSLHGELHPWSVARNAYDGAKRAQALQEWSQTHPHTDVDKRIQAILARVAEDKQTAREALGGAA